LNLAAVPFAVQYLLLRLKLNPQTRDLQVQRMRRGVPPFIFKKRVRNVIIEVS
jgi:hypothetical protein